MRIAGVEDAFSLQAAKDRAMNGTSARIRMGELRKRDGAIIAHPSDLTSIIPG
jgi:hypothetical protein